MSASGEGRAWEAPPASGRAALWWAGKQPPHQQPRTPAALETALLPAHPLPWRAPSGQTEASEAHTGFCDKKGACGFSSLHFILAAHMSLTQEPRGRQRKTEVINLHL